MSYSRMIGNNIAIELSNQGRASDILTSLGYSSTQIEKILEGRMILTRSDVKEIADILHVPEDVLVTSKGYEVYNQLVHNMGYCNNEADQDFIFDIFDMYADLKEAVLKIK